MHICIKDLYMIGAVFLASYASLRLAAPKIGEIAKFCVLLFQDGLPWFVTEWLFFLTKTTQSLSLKQQTEKWKRKTQRTLQRYHITSLAHNVNNIREIIGKKITTHNCNDRIVPPISCFVIGFPNLTAKFCSIWLETLSWLSPWFFLALLQCTKCYSLYPVITG